MEGVPTITAKELKAKLDRKDDFILIFTLEPFAFAKMHIPRSINIPYKEIGKRSAELDKNKEIVTYCTDVQCTASPIAARKLLALGFTKVREFSGGIREWTEAGYPVEGEEKGR